MLNFASEYQHPVVMKYPIGIQNFEQLREEGYVYVDKTALIYKMATEGHIYFLGRPRRFGKSLLVSTLENYFLGRKELFTGLAIEKLEKNWAVYPVFHLDFNGKVFSSPMELDNTLENFVASGEEKYGKSPFATTLGDRLAFVFERAHEKSGRRAVVLVDEYDKPLLDVMNTGIPSPMMVGQIKTLEDYNREILKGFYSVFKLADKHLQFVLLTGVTKFSQISVFSGFNQPDDISFDPRFDSLCGITEEELHTVFFNQIELLGKQNGMNQEEAIAMLKRKYDGYHFSRRMTDIFNPFSILNCLAKGEFNNYWFATGTPSYLMRLMADNHDNINELAGQYYSSEEFVEYKSTCQSPLPMLYQSGYLTVKGIDARRNSYLLDFPNEEVRSGMITMLAANYFSDGCSQTSWLDKVSDSLETGNLDQFKLLLISFLSQISYRFQRKQDERECERHFQYTFYLIMQLLGKYNTYVEKETSQGRIDCVLECPCYVYIFEFKLNSTADIALKQIEDRGYALPYASDSRQLYKVGISFSSETGTVNDFDYSPKKSSVTQ